VRRAVLVVLTLLLGGCPPKPTPPSTDDVIEQLKQGGDRSRVRACNPAPLEIFLQADPQLNLNEQGQPMPVEVRVLLLRERDVFDTLDFEVVWRDAATALVKDLVTSASLTVFPGKLKIYPMKSGPGASYVALVGIFRRPEQQSWKYVVDIKEQNRRCAARDDLHTIIHAQLKDSRISNPE
jgi:type VI secretion system protein VasD